MYVLGFRGKLIFEFAGKNLVDRKGVGVEDQHVGSFFGAVRSGLGLGAESFEDAGGVVAAAHGHATGAGDFEDFVAGLAEDLEEAFDLGGRAGHFEHDGFGGEIDDAGAEDLGEFEDLGARVEAVGLAGAGGDLDEAELADDGLRAVDLVHVDGGFELVERGSDAVRGVLMRLADDGHAGGVVALGLADGERDDIDVETAEEAGDAGEDAGLVLDEGYEGVEHEGLGVKEDLRVVVRRASD
jgi:hypothetical protein